MFAKPEYPFGLRVIGSDRMFESFLPMSCEVFPSSEFLHTPSAQMLGLVDPARASELLTIVVNPEDYNSKDLHRLSGRVWFWFLRRLNFGPRGKVINDGRLKRRVAQALSMRQIAARRVLDAGPELVLASDTESVDFFQSLGQAVLMSPPPVGKPLLSASPLTTDRKRILQQEDPFSLYSTYFLDAAQELSQDVQITDSLGPIPGAVFTIGNPVLPGLDYQAAQTLRSGKLLLSTAMEPLWGLEAGIDFIEISSPQELIECLRYLRRNPATANLMRSRGLLKSKIFEAESVYRRVLRDWRIK